MVAKVSLGNGLLTVVHSWTRLTPPPASPIMPGTMACTIPNAQQNPKVKAELTDLSSVHRLRSNFLLGPSRPVAVSPGCSPFASDLLNHTRSPFDHRAVKPACRAFVRLWPHPAARGTAGWLAGAGWAVRRGEIRNRPVATECPLQGALLSADLIVNLFANRLIPPELPACDVRDRLRSTLTEAMTRSAFFAIARLRELLPNLPPQTLMHHRLAGRAIARGPTWRRWTNDPAWSLLLLLLYTC